MVFGENQSLYILTRQMNHKIKSILLAALLISCCIPAAYPVNLDRVITISGNDQFELLHGRNIEFQFKPLSSKARTLEITENTSALGVTYLGQLLLGESSTTLDALRNIADQIGRSLGLRFGVITDSTTSDVLKESKQLLLYHPDLTITLTLVKPIEQEHYEIICTYVVRETKTSMPADTEHTVPTQATASTNTVPSPAPSKKLTD